MIIDLKRSIDLGQLFDLVLLLSLYDLVLSYICLYITCGKLYDILSLFCEKSNTRKSYSGDGGLGDEKL